MRAPNKEITKLIRLARKQGFVVERSKNGHYHVHAAGSREVAVLPSSPSRGGERDAKSSLRKIGMDV